MAAMLPTLWSAFGTLMEMLDIVFSSIERVHPMAKVSDKVRTNKRTI